MMTKLVCMLRFQVGISFEDLYMRAAISLLFSFLRTSSLVKRFQFQKHSWTEKLLRRLTSIQILTTSRMLILTEPHGWQRIQVVHPRTGRLLEPNGVSRCLSIQRPWGIRLAAKGDCYGAIDLYAYTDDDDSPAVTTFKPKVRHSAFSQEGAVLKIIPRPILVGEDTYWLSRLYASFGNMPD